MQLVPKIRECRKKRNLTQEQLAELCGIPAPHISNYETGKVYPSIENLWILAHALDCLVDDLYEIEYTPLKKYKP